MIEEYISILKNDVWDIVPNPKKNQLFLLNGCLKLSMHLMAALKSTKLDLQHEVSHRKKASIMKKHLCHFLDTLELEPSWISQHPKDGKFIKWMSKQHS